MALTAANAARRDTILDTKRRVNGEVTTWRALIERGYFLSRRVENGTHYLCTDPKAADGYKVPTMVSEWAGALPTLNIVTDASGRIVSKEWA